jgi:CubicO group peptidase (beta-lactamase class C family)
MNNKLTVLSLILASGLYFLMTSCGLTSGSDSVQSRITAVENGLLPVYYKSGTTPAGMSITDRLAHYYTPAVSIAVVNNGTIEWAKGYGTLVTADSLFQACSISKPVASLGFMLLTQTGSIELDRNINDYLTSWKVADNAFTATAKVTVRRLLSHSAGINNSGFNGYAAGQTLPTLLQTLNGTAPANNPPISVEAIPGTAYSYSGGGMEILHQLVEDVTGTAFKDYMNDQVLSKLGMTSSAFLQPLSGPLLSRAVSAHDYSGNAVAGGWNTYPELAAAGLWTTPTDLARVIIEVQQAAVSKGTILSKATVDQMLTTQITDTDGSQMGLGFKVKPLGSDVEFSHTGDNNGFKTYLVGFRDSGKGAVVMTNAENGGLLMLEVMRGIAKVYGWPDITPEAKTLIDVSAGTLATYVGSYEPAGSGIVYEIAMSGTQLALRIPGIAVLNELYPDAADSFLFFWAKGTGTVTFSRDTAGQVNGLTLSTNGITVTAPKK